MTDYRVYLIGADGCFYKSVDLNEANDAAAIAAAKRLVDGHDVELWEGDRKIASFSEEQNSSAQVAFLHAVQNEP